jgi:hypothetical protein
LEKYHKAPLSKTGKDIIDICFSGGSVQEYIDIIPMDYQYSFTKSDDEMNGEYMAG